MSTRLIFFCIIVKLLRRSEAICSVSKYNEDFGDWVKCSNSTVNQANNKGGPVVSAMTISHSTIFNIPENAFRKHIKSLRMLNLQNCGIRDMHANALDGLIVLKKLHLPNNNLTTVRSSWFENLVSLEQLDLSFNAIKNIEPMTFLRLANLRRLNLDDNSLTCLEPKDMNPMISITKFRVLENPLSLVCRGRMTLWFNDKGINYSNGLGGGSGNWLDRVLWLCAEEDSGKTSNDETRMRECVLLNLFDQLRLALETTNSYQTSAQQCCQQRQIFTSCIAKSGRGPGRITNGEALSNMRLALREAQEKLGIF